MKLGQAVTEHERSASADSLPSSLGEDLLHLLPMAVYVCDAQGVIVRYNRRAAELWGREPAAGDTDERFCGAHRLFDLDGRPLPHAETPMAAALRFGISTRDQEVVIERPGGDRVVVAVNIDPLKDHSGRIVGAINCFQDVTAHKQAQEEAHRARRDLEDFFDNGTVGLHWVASNGIILRANRAELELLGYAPEEYIGRHIAEFHVDSETITDILARLSRGETLDKYWARLRARDGSVKHVLISSNVRFEDGLFLNTRCFTIDVTERHRAEEHQQLLMAELDHRVKNVLATVQSIAIRSLGAAPGSEAFLGRLDALARAHTMLSEKEWRGVELSELLESILVLHQAGRTRVELEGPKIKLDPKLAQTLALAVHELSTNAAKYGALSNATGLIRVRWEVLDGPERLHLLWRESGGPPVAAPTARGFGTSLIERSLNYEFGAETRMKFDSEGLRFETVLPLQDDAVGVGEHG